jgi:hypothetical protein
MSDFTLRLSFRNGWCDLVLADGDEPVRLRTHWMSDGFLELLLAVEALLAGRRSVSVRWAHEIGGGHFIDLGPAPHGELGLAVHDIVERTDDERAAAIWSAERGKCIFRAHTTLDAVVTQVMANVHRIRLRDVDPTTGMTAQWPRTFPTALYERLEQQAVLRFGYRPLFRIELDHDDPV